MNADFLDSRNIYRAYISCRRRKNCTYNAQKFRLRFSQNMVGLTRALQEKHYKPGRSICFVVQNPKPREVFAADFKDRIVHHLLVEELEKYWEKIFIFDSYACRKGKGNLAAVERVEHFMRSVSNNGKQKAFFLQIDIKNFFMSIDKNILWSIVQKGIEKQFQDKKRAADVAEVAKILLFHNPTRNYSDRARAEEWKLVPSQKSLFYAGENKGLPIGNLTSQFFANVYLNELDQFVKHELKIKCYVRYVDDIVIIHQEKKQLAEWLDKIRAFLHEHLKLELKSAVKLAGLSCGINFLGYVQHIFYRLPRRRVLNNIRIGLKKWSKINESRELDFEDLKNLRSSLNSYLAYAAKAKSFRAMKEIFKPHGWIWKFFKLCGEKVVLKAEYIEAEKQAKFNRIFGGTYGEVYD